MGAQTFSLPLIEKKQVSRDAYAFYFQKDPQFSFSAGQYIRVTLPLTHPDERGNSRLFSLILSPLDTEKIGITTRIVQSPFKHALLALPIGTPVQIFGPMGKFVLEENEQQPQVFLAGGIGITPFSSMIRFAADKNLTVSITLIASFSTVEEMIFYQELTILAQTHPSIKVVYTITQPDMSQQLWQGEAGRISKELIMKYVPNNTSVRYSLAGPNAMVDGMTTLLTDMGIAQEQIRREIFVGY